MNKRTKLAAIGALLALGVGAFAAPHALDFTHASIARRLHELPEVTTFVGEVGIEFRVRDLGLEVIGDRLLEVVDLDPSLPKLVGGVVDDREPNHAVATLNGHAIDLALQPDGTLSTTLPQSAFNWFLGNELVVEVFDAMGDSIVTWTSQVGPLI